MIGVPLTSTLGVQGKDFSFWFAFVSFGGVGKLVCERFGYSATLRLRHARGGSGAVTHRRCVAHDASRELSVLAKVGV